MERVDRATDRVTTMIGKQYNGRIDLNTDMLNIDRVIAA